MNKSVFVVTALAALAGGITSASAEEVEEQVGGQTCVGIFSADRSTQVFTPKAAQNDDPNVFHSWVCPAVWEGGVSFADSADAVVFYFDNSTIGSVRCSLRLTAGNTGSDFTGADRFSCSSGVGCTADSEPGFTSTSPRRLFLGATHPNIEKGSWALLCQIPPRGNARSGIGSVVYKHDRF